MQGLGNDRHGVVHLRPAGLLLPSLKSALLCSVAVSFIVATAGLSARAADGDGGLGGDNTRTSVGGSASATSAGSAGSNGVGTTNNYLSAGAGGGSGLTGGSGGEGAGANPGTAGAGASATGAAGSDGTKGGDNSSGGGGGGGAHAYVGSITDLSAFATLTGGAGGNGGLAGFAGYGGGGGGGGFGAVVTGLAGSGGSITVNATGGAGGAYGWAGAGGNGGSGLVIYQPAGDNVISITGSTLTGGAGGGSRESQSYGGSGGSGLVLSGGTGATTVQISGGSITGGDAAGGAYGGAGGNGILVEAMSGPTTLDIAATVTGGAGGSGLYTNGEGGSGVRGENLAISIAASGSVSGGLDGSGARAVALNFAGGTNRLTLASEATLTGGIVVATDTTTLEFAQATDYTLSNVISGDGSISKTGAGTLTLTGANTYTGSTTVSAGTLALSGSGSLATSSSVTIGKGTLDISGTTAGATIQDLSSSDSEARVVLGSQTLTLTTANLNTFAGVISGNGGLTVSGTLPSGLILTGDNTYLGTTTVNGALAIGYNSASGSVAGDIVVNAGGSLIFGRNDSYTIENSLTAAAGSLIGFAYGTYSYAGSGVISGDVMVQSAELHLIADEFANASSVALNSGGTLSGNGTVANLIVNGGGIVAPGNSPGTIAVNGTVAFDAGSIYRVDVTSAGAHDLITATGAATIDDGAEVALTAAPGDYTSGIRYTLLAATGGVTGNFGSVSESYAFLDGALEADTNNIYLLVYYNGVPFASYARTPNQFGTAVAAQALGGGNAIYDALLLLPENAVPAAFDALSGEAYASVSSMLQQQSIYVRDAVSGRLRQALTAPGASPLAYGPGPAKAPLAEGYAPTLWAQGYGGWGNTYGNGNAASISNTIGGFLIGADVSVAENARAGLFGGYSRSTFDVAGRSSSGSTNNYDLGLYAGAQFGAVALRGGASYTWHDLSLSRSVVFPGFAESLKGSDTTGTAQVFGEIGYDVEMGAIALEPFLGLAYVNVSGASLGEEGGAAALSVSTDDMSTVYSTLGVRLATTVDVGGRTLTPYATLGWQHAFGDVTPSSTMQFAGGLTPFTVSGVPVAEDALLVEAGLSYALSASAQIGVTYAGQLAGEASQNAFTAQFALRF